MTVVVDTRCDGTIPPRGRSSRTALATVRRQVRALRRRPGPTAFVAVNALMFWLMRPGVPDIWAARARAVAAGHGVGVTYWFGWFGGSSPGSYSVLSPLVDSSVGTELATGVAAIAVSALASVLVRDTRHPAAAAWVAALCACINLWCGRAPFLLGAAIALGALVLVGRRSIVATAVVSAVSVLASPVSGAFLALGLAGAALGRSTRPYRPAALAAIGGAGCALVTLAVLFGSPGPEPMPAYVVVELLATLCLLLLLRPDRQLRTSMLICAVAVMLLAFVPNGMGSNIGRFTLYCLPVAAVALSRRALPAIAALIVPVLVLGGIDVGSALVSASQPGSSRDYYAPLVAELDRLHPTDQRLELTNGGHAAYTVLLGHAVLARGWETQEDSARNAVLQSATLDTGSYRRWLDDNAVGYVAMIRGGTDNPETKAADSARAGYLHEIWRSSRWRLYAVLHARPIVGGTGVLQASTQSTMTLRVSCACTTSVRVRWSKFLQSRAVVSSGVPDAVEDSYRSAVAQDPSGWTELVTSRPGTYVLSGS